MFFDIALLCPQSNGKFAIVWIAATRGCNKLSKKQILNVDVVRTCSDIASMCLNESQKPRERLSLSLSARLINGVIKILFQQTRILQDHLFQCWTLPTTLLIEPVGTTRKKVPKKIRIRTLPAVEIQPQQPGQTDVVTEFIITDQDVEQALHQQPTTHIDSITLRVTEFIITDQDVEQALHQQPTTHIDSICINNPKM
ncbi:N terminus of Rad21 / Rec8 like protein [Popillia japonica]|uniref:N terminus of Rad21 / Rec8 like protein n=1 Tax=Popillia japonica TaxID=7064 RepID=A0AAW1JEB2_POPJA